MWQYHHVDEDSIPQAIHDAYKSGEKIAAGSKVGEIFYWTVTSFGELVGRAAIGPIPGWAVLGLGGVYCLSWGLISVWSGRADTARARKRRDPLGMG